MNIETIFLKGKRVELRPLRSDTDLESCYRWVNDPNIRQFITRIIPMTIGSEREWIDQHTINDENIVLGIIVGSRLIGTVGLHHISWIHRSAVTGTMIGEADMQSKGYGFDAKMTILDYAFNQLNLRKISSFVFDYNARSQKCLAKCGYKEIGRRKRHIFSNGQYHDEVLFELFREDWNRSGRISQTCSQSLRTTKKSSDFLGSFT
jgi:RimJ/RimL family protein N-acetyltransferase